MLGLSVCSTTEYESVPENSELFSGYSVTWWDMQRYDNYENVSNYSYRSKQYSLLKQDFSFYEEVDYLREINMEETAHYPQGICLTDDYLLVTAYAEQEDALGKVFVYDVNTGEYLVTLAMDANSHMGGIAFDGENIWICNSSQMAIERLSYEMVSIAVAFHEGKIVDVRNMVEQYKVDVIPSSVTFHDGKLWVAAHTKFTSSQMVSYSFQMQSKTLKLVDSYTIPSKVQGITFSENDELFFSTSYGRNNSSYIRKYSSIEALEKGVKNYSELIELPPCSEGICFKSGKLYVVFESAGEKYAEGTDGNGKCSSPLDKILIISEK